MLRLPNWQQPFAEAAQIRAHARSHAEQSREVEMISGWLPRLLLDRWGSVSAPVSTATAAAFLRGRGTLRSE